MSELSFIVATILPTPTNSSRRTNSLQPVITHRLVDRLEDADFDRDEGPFMRIDWYDPSSIAEGIGNFALRAAERGKRNPPLNIYAKHRDYKQNLKMIRVYYKGNTAEEDKAWQDYRKLSLHEVGRYYTNIDVMVKMQVCIYNKFTKGEHVPLINSFIPIAETLQRRDPRVVTPPAIERASRGSSEQTAESQQHQELDEDGDTTMDLELDSSANEGSMMQEEPDEEPEEEEPEERNEIETGNIFQGGFGLANQRDAARSIAVADVDESQPRRRKRHKAVSHCATNGIKEKLFSLLKCTGNYMDTCVSDADGKWELNDVIVIHVRNKEFAKKQNGGNKMKELPNGGTRVTIFGRSIAMIKRIFNLAALGIQKDEKVEFHTIHPVEGDESVMPAFERFMADIETTRDS